jgi:hypothetical protein
MITRIYQDRGHSAPRRNDTPVQACRNVRCACNPLRRAGTVKWEFRARGTARAAGARPGGRRRRALTSSAPWAGGWGCAAGLHGLAARLTALRGGRPRILLDSIAGAELIDRHDKALLSVMLYSFSRVTAVVGLKVRHYEHQRRRAYLALHEKGGQDRARAGPQPGRRGPRSLPQDVRARHLPGGPLF